MHTFRRAVTGIAVSGLFTMLAAPAIAAPTETAKGGKTTVLFAPGFLTALGTLNVAPAAVSPARIAAKNGGVSATFPITTGLIDLGTLKAEISHAGGLSLTAGTTRVQLTSFIVDSTGTTPVLTGLVTTNGDLRGRLTLFNLNAAAIMVNAKGEKITLSNVAVTLAPAAATALNGELGTTALAGGLPVGTATVNAKLDDDDDHDD